MGTYNHTASTAWDAYDLALLELVRPMPDMQPVRLLSVIDRQVESGDTLSVSGFGTTDPLWEDRPIPSSLLQIVETRVEERRETELLTNPIGENGGACNGDSGGPNYLMHDDDVFLVAVTSRLRLDRPVRCGGGGVHTLVSAHEEWIRSTTTLVVGPALPIEEGCAVGGDPTSLWFALIPLLYLRTRKRPQPWG